MTKFRIYYAIARHNCKKAITIEHKWGEPSFYTAARAIFSHEFEEIDAPFETLSPAEALRKFAVVDVDVRRISDD